MIFVTSNEKGPLMTNLPRIELCLLLIVGQPAMHLPLAAQELTECVGDCDANGQITINELVRGVAIALGTEAITRCVAADSSGNQAVAVSELVQAVNAALRGCLAPASLFLEPPLPSCAGSAPDWIAVDDLDGDGALDIVTVDREFDAVGVLLGDGTGGIGAAQSFDVGMNPRGAAATDTDGDDVLELPDVDGDGHPDIVAAIQGERGLAILIGDGLGGFGAPQSIPLASARPQAVAVADLDGDGTLDAVTASSTPGDGDVRVVLGLAAQDTVTAGTEPRDVEIADFDGDGVPDIAACNVDSNDVAIFLGLGDGAFGPLTLFSVGSEPQHLAVGDLDGSGTIDIVTVNRDSNDISVLAGNGDGTFATPRHYPVGSNPRDVAIADLDRDGRRDIVVANRGSNSLSVLLGSNSGLFRLVENIALPESACNADRLLTAGPRGVAIGDWNQDGKLDLISANSRSGSVSVALQK